MRFSSFKAVQHIYSTLIFYVSKRFKWAEFSFPSTLQLSSFLELLLEPIDHSETTHKIQLGLHEALVNAVLHGNNGDASKYLRVRRIVTPNWFIWQIQDEGEGIPLQERKKTLPSNLDSNNGRGLFLIHHCFDDVRWSRRGNRLQLAVRRSHLINDQDNSEPLSLF